MAEETYTKEQLEGMNRLHLRRIAKKLDLDGDAITDMKAAAIIDYILEKQEGGGGKKGGKRGAAKKEAEPKEEKPRRGPPSRRGRKADPEPEPEVDPDTGEVGGDMAEVLNAVADVSKRIDELGEVTSTNSAELDSTITDLHAEVYCIKGMIMNLFKYLNEEQIISSDGTEDLEELEKECEGNE